MLKYIISNANYNHNFIGLYPFTILFFQHLKLNQRTMNRLMQKSKHYGAKIFATVFEKYKNWLISVLSCQVLCDTVIDNFIDFEIFKYECRYEITARKHKTAILVAKQYL